MRVSGVLTGPDGPAANHGLRLWPVPANDGGYEIPIAYATTDSRGRFAFLGVPPGAYIIRAYRVQPTGPIFIPPTAGGPPGTRVEMLDAAASPIPSWFGRTAGDCRFVARGWPGVDDAAGSTGIGTYRVRGRHAASRRPRACSRSRFRSARSSECSGRTAERLARQRARAVRVAGIRARALRGAERDGARDPSGRWRRYGSARPTPPVQADHDWCRGRRRRRHHVYRQGDHVDWRGARDRLDPRGPSDPWTTRRSCCFRPTIRPGWRRACHRAGLPRRLPPPLARTNSRCRCPASISSSRSRLMWRLKSMRSLRSDSVPARCVSHSRPGNRRPSH